MDENTKRDLRAALDRGDLWTMRKILARSGSGGADPDAPADANQLGSE